MEHFQLIKRSHVHVSILLKMNKRWFNVRFSFIFTILMCSSSYSYLCLISIGYFSLGEISQNYICFLRWSFRCYVLKRCLVYFPYLSLDIFYFSLRGIFCTNTVCFNCKISLFDCQNNCDLLMRMSWKLIFDFVQRLVVFHFISLEILY